MEPSGLSLGQETDRLSPDRRSGSEWGRAEVRGEHTRTCEVVLLRKPGVLTTVSLQIKLE